MAENVACQNSERLRTLQTESDPHDDFESNAPLGLAMVALMALTTLDMQAQSYRGKRADGPTRWAA